MKASSKWPDDFVHVTYDPAQVNQQQMLELIREQEFTATVQDK